MLMTCMPGRFSVELRLSLERRRPRTLFLWFLASILYGARISGTIAGRTYREFLRRGLVSPRRILDAGWNRLVEALDAGGYARYDFKTATKLLAVMQSLAGSYRGSLNELHEAAADARDLEARLKGLGPGVGDITVQIFLRELRGIWPKADSALSPLSRLAAEHLGLFDGRAPSLGSLALQALKDCWQDCRVRYRTFSDFESALVRLGRGYCRSRRGDRCPMREYCPARPSKSPKGADRTGR